MSLRVERYDRRKRADDVDGFVNAHTFLIYCKFLCGYLLFIINFYSSLDLFTYSSSKLVSGSLVLRGIARYFLFNVN